MGFDLTVSNEISFCASKDNCVWYQWRIWLSAQKKIISSSILAGDCLLDCIVYYDWLFPKTIQHCNENILTSTSVPSNLKLQKAKIYFQANLDFSTVLQSIRNLPLHILTTEFDNMLKIKKWKYATSRLGPGIILTELQIHIKLISCRHHSRH